MSRGPSVENRWPIDESLGSYREDGGLMGQVVDFLFFVAMFQRSPVIESTCRRVANPEKNRGMLSRCPEGESIDRSDGVEHRKTKRDRDCRLAWRDE